MSNGLVQFFSPSSQFGFGTDYFNKLTRGEQFPEYPIRASPQEDLLDFDFGSVLFAVFKVNAQNPDQDP